MSRWGRRKREEQTSRKIPGRTAIHCPLSSYSTPTPGRQGAAGAGNTADGLSGVYSLPAPLVPGCLWLGWGVSSCSEGVARQMSAGRGPEAAPGPWIAVLGSEVLG